MRVPGLLEKAFGLQTLAALQIESVAEEWGGKAQDLRLRESSQKWPTIYVRAPR
jgi:hypothetical protein